MLQSLFSVIRKEAKKYYLILSAFLLAGCAPQYSFTALTLSETPPIIDDFSKDSLNRALSFHLDYLKNLPDQTPTPDGLTAASKQDYIDSLLLFRKLIKESNSPAHLEYLIKNHFNVYQARGRSHRPFGEMLVTGYYEPLLEGRLHKNPPFIYPLYSPPTSLIQRKIPGSSKRIKGRQDATGKFIPYWTRAEIETQGHAKGFELVYLKDPFEAFILHVQGSGKIRLKDGSIRSIHYASDNGRKYNSIGKLLVDMNKMELADVSTPSIHEYLQNHPEEQQRIFHHNKKFIFFKWEKENGPFGSLGKTLTPGRSIAVDSKILPMNMIAFLTTRRPVINAQGKVTGWKPFNRFVFPQDTGSAIKGSGRVDIFWGNGSEAEISAGVMKEKGSLYYLMKKPTSTQ
jgi:membrane-bound lytic murein transglycosylase A